MSLAILALFDLETRLKLRNRPVAPKLPPFKLQFSAVQGLLLRPDLCRIGPREESMLRILGKAQPMRAKLALEVQQTS